MECASALRGPAAMIRCAAVNGRRKVVTALAAAALVAAGTSRAGEARTNLNVVASFYPIYVATLNVVGHNPGVSVSSMAQPTAGDLGARCHDWKLETDTKARSPDTRFYLRLPCQSWMRRLWETP